MQQSWNMSPYAVGAGGHAPAGSREDGAVRRYGILFGLLNGLFAIAQVAISTSAALENHAALGSLYYGLKNQALDPSTVFSWLVPVLVSAYGSCLVAFGFGMWLCWQAGRATALAAGRDAGGANAGMLTSLVGSGVWIVASVAGVLILHTDGTISGILSSTPDRSAANLGGELAGLLTQEVVGALVALGFGAVAGRLGAGSVRFPSRGMPSPMYVPLYAAMPAPPPSYMVGNLPPMPYPPPPEFYRGLAPAPGQPPASGWPPTYPGGALYPQAYPVPPGYPPASGPTEGNPGAGGPPPHGGQP